MAEHKGRWNGEPREFPQHELYDADGERIIMLAAGDHFVTHSLAFFDDHPDLAERLDKPRKPAAKRAVASDEAVQEPQDDAEPATAGQNPED